MSSEQHENHWTDYYQVLGVQYHDSPMTVRQAWHQLSYIYHQDVGCNAQVNRARIQELNEAYKVLSDPSRRAKYEQAYRSRAKEPSAPSPEAPTGDPAPPPLPEPPPPPASRHPQPVRSRRRGGLAYMVKVIAAAGAVTVLTLIAAGAIGELRPWGNGFAVPLPWSFYPATPTPLPGAALTPDPAGMPIGAPALGGTTDSAEVSPAPSLAPRNPILVISPEAEALGFRGFQVGGNPWTVDISNECQEAPCLRSGIILGAGISILWLNVDNLPASARIISFDVKAASPACCASFQIIAAPTQITVKLPNGHSWARMEVPVPETRPVAMQWEFWSPSGASRLDGIWVDNIQFK